MPTRQGELREVATATAEGPPCFASFGVEPAVLLAGEVLSQRFRIVRGLGRGGMGQVYEAIDLELDQAVALKVIRPELALRPSIVERFKREVRLARRVSSPHVCRIFDLENHHDPASPRAPRLDFLTMELLPGPTLASVLAERGAIPPTEASEWIRQLAVALHVAHQAGVVHGDFKPSNVLQGSDAGGRWVVTDFGLARALDRPGRAEGPVVGKTAHEGYGVRGRGGTPAYLAPEQRSGGEPSVATDLYALGLVIFEILSGRRPRRDSEGRLSPDEWEALPSDLRPQLLVVLQTCLDPGPAGRPGSAREILERLDAAGALAEDFNRWRPTIGQQLPRRPHWRVEARLGAGGFGEAWRVRHRKTGEVRVLKFSHDTEGLAALQREVTLYRLLLKELGDRDDIHRILDWSLDEPPYSIESEYSSGGDLEAWLDRRGRIESIPRGLLLELLAQVAEALAAAHSIGVLHRDVKPGNILIAEHSGVPRARVADFGVAVPLEAERLADPGFTVLGMTQSDSSDGIVGTRLYAAPELVEGKGATVQADIFALGVVLYQLVVGDFRRALAAGWEREIDDPLLVSDIAAAVDGAPERRPAAQQLADRLRNLEGRRADLERQAKLEDERVRNRAQLASSRRRWRLALGVATVSLLVATVFGWLSHRVAQEASQARDMARLSQAVEWMEEDPTLAALALLEIDSKSHETQTQMRRALGHPLARYQVRFPEPIYHITVGPGARRVVGSTATGRLYEWLPPHGGTKESPIRELEGTAEEPLPWMGVDRSGTRLAATAADGSVWFWDLETGRSRRLGRHRGRLWRGAFDPSGTRLVTPGEDHVARIWPVGGGPPVELVGHEHWVIDAQFDHDGSRVVTASRDGTVRIWDARTGGQLEILEGHRSWVFYAEFSPDGRRVVSASRDHTSRIWDLEGETPVRILEGHLATVDRAYFRPDGLQVLTSSQDGTARTWGIDGTAQSIVVRARSSVIAGYVSDGAHIWGSSESQIWRVPVDSETTPRIYDVLGGPFSADLDPSGQWLASVLDNEVRLFPLGEELLSDVLVTRDTAFDGLATESMTGRIAVGSSRGMVGLVVPGGRQLHSVGVHRGAVLDVAFRPDGRQLATGSRDDTIGLWSLDGSHGPQVLRGHEGSVGNVVYHPSGDWLVSGGFDHGVRFWQTAGSEATGLGRLLTQYRFPVSVLYGLDLSADGRHLAVSARAGMQILELPDGFPGTGGPRPILEDSRAFRCLDFDRSGRWLAAVRNQGMLTVWDASRLVQGELRLLAEVEVGRTQAHCGDFVGDRYAVPTGDGSIWLVDWLRDRPPIELLGHGNRVRNVRVLEADAALVSSSVDGTLRWWRIDERDPFDVLTERVQICLDAEGRQRHLLEDATEARRRALDCRERLAVPPWGAL